MPHHRSRIASNTVVEELSSLLSIQSGTVDTTYWGGAVGRPAGSGWRGGTWLSKEAGLPVVVAVLAVPAG
jgi:hypothetical protein